MPRSFPLSPVPRSTMRRAARFALSAVLASLLIAPASAMSAGELTVSAAASLSDAFRAMAGEFRKATGITVHLNSASSNTLLRQLRSGAPADVFASADAATMDEAAASALILPETRRDFAATTLVLITPAEGRPAPTPDALTGPDFRRIAVGSPQSVPAGRYAREALEHAALWEALAPRLLYGASVRQVLAYVQRGEADAGIVYRTDALRAGKAVRIDRELEGHTPVVYPMAVTALSRSPERARRFLDFALSPSGQGILARYGFTAAP